MISLIGLRTAEPRILSSTSIGYLDILEVTWPSSWTFVMYAVKVALQINCQIASPACPVGGTVLTHCCFFCFRFVFLKREHGRKFRKTVIPSLLRRGHTARYVYVNFLVTTLVSISVKWQVIESASYSLGNFYFILNNGLYLPNCDKV